ncbi:MAG: class E sortase [Actinomycetia bacterium]|nr:class E sortase [Actinomycetes bacterium]
MATAGASAGLLAALPAPARALAAPDGVVPGGNRQSTAHRSQSSGAAMGTMRIPDIGLDETVRSGIAIEVINKGVAHWAGTSEPGGEGNMVLAGHRTTYTRPFYNLDRLDPGNMIYVTGANGFDVMYRVNETFIVEPEDLWITYERGKSMMTMFACHPKGSTRYRIVVTADLVAGGQMS